MIHNYKIGVVEYLNAKPLLFKYEEESLFRECKIIFDYPSNLRKKFLTNEVDIALLPVASLLDISVYHFISNYCIGAEQCVASVGVCSNLPIQKLKKIYLDYQSFTSNTLLKVLINQFLKIEIALVPIFELSDTPPLITPHEGLLLIGDRALEQRKNFKYFFDLAQAWITYTQMPFVFATWVSNKSISQDFMTAFNVFQQKNLARLSIIIQSLSCSFYNLEKYFTKNISYPFDSKKKAGLAHFLSLCKKHNLKNVL